MTKSPKLAIVGNGAIGNLLALKCQSTNTPYCLLTRDGKDVEVVIQDQQGKHHGISPPVREINQPGEIDIVVLPLKAYQIESALLSLKKNLTVSTTLILLHNGMGCTEIAQRHFPQNPIVAATTSCASYKASPNKAFETGSGPTGAGWIQYGDPENQGRIISLLDKLLPPLTWFEDVFEPLWRKLSVNAVINPLTTIYQIKNGQLRHDKYKKLILSLCQETALVMQASGYDVSAYDLESSARLVMQRTAENYSSMNRDVANNRETEIDFINGYIVTKAEKAGVKVEHHQWVLAQFQQFGKNISKSEN